MHEVAQGARHDAVPRAVRLRPAGRGAGPAAAADRLRGRRCAGGCTTPPRSSVVPTAAGPVTVISTHLNPFSPYRRLREARWLAARYRPRAGTGADRRRPELARPGHRPHRDGWPGCPSSTGAATSARTARADTRAIAEFAGRRLHRPVAGRRGGRRAHRADHRGGGREFSAPGCGSTTCWPAAPLAARRHACPGDPRRRGGVRLRPLPARRRPGSLPASGRQRSATTRSRPARLAAYRLRSACDSRAGRGGPALRRGRHADAGRSPAARR